MGKTKHELKVEREKFQAEVKALLEKYDTDGSKSLDTDEVRKLIEELDHAPPLAKDVNWVMKMGDKDGGGTIAFAELYVVLQKYKKYRHDNPDLLKLITKHDKNSDMELSSSEMKGLLKEVSGGEVSDSDVEYVMKEFQAQSTESMKVKKGIDPDALAKAISNWQDKSIDEGTLFGFHMPKMEVPSFAPPDLSGATAWTDSIFGCCTQPEDRKTGLGKV
eukprot:CAMPEP_0173391082 /NCGR_PEP_ID=MMETSP1356-20130122/17236_1 /TAXON_ID=77927 ORGANISM="Hemiselmis virescens, Strain PCC157" /NCGR_SAMPLE_ID=MMETSP1356 /ASSEMBLY_ACC=CAM_ASM_000847 /LENGTH=218 /DNA_ID=CAMNT_0014348621 /DNA_START=60 /DNA_END=716 /DNA_ORIENTATION=+